MPAYANCNPSNKSYITRLYIIKFHISPHISWLRSYISIPETCRNLTMKWLCGFKSSWPTWRRNEQSPIPNATLFHIVAKKSPSSQRLLSKKEKLLKKLLQYVVKLGTRNIVKYAMKSIVIHVVNESCKINSHTLIQTKRLMDVIFWLVVSSWTVLLKGHM